MEPITLTTANRTLAAPASWDAAAQGSCGELSVRVLHNEGGPSYFESAWRPSQLELSWLLRGGVVMLRTVGVQPPVSVSVLPATAIEEVPEGPAAADRKAG